jgi:hypothetical protein
MRTRLSISREGIKYALRLTEIQRSAISSVLLFMRDRNGSGGMTVQLGCSREFLMEVYLRVDRNEEHGWSATQFHVVYAALISVGILFVSEEDFYIRLGFFRENSTALALSLVEAISACDAE